MEKKLKDDGGFLLCYDYKSQEEIPQLSESKIVWLL